MSGKERDEVRARRYAGVARLYGEAASLRFARTHIAVVGLGGVGSWAAEALARSGVGALTLIDLDHIAESNINRQLHALTDDIGRAKVEAMAERIARIDAHCRVTAIDDFLTPENCAALLANCDAVFDAVDDVQAKAAMVSWCREQARPLVVCGAAGGQRDATAIRHADLALVRNDALLAKLRSRLRRDHGFPRGVVKGRVKPFHVSAVFVDAAPTASPLACAPGAALNCAGYGSVMHVTAGIGLAAAGVLLDHIAALP
ncbi:MAG TPA: tRNA threonylcarbamoyladenosine dehydratase [Burkholderiaceae bacterium]|nr:tRNA threonylcarbamoyladenosine dehydratase [Burkholderiaceae bacterium]